MFFRDVAHIYNWFICMSQKFDLKNHMNIICYMIKFPTPFMKLCHACKRLKTNAKCSIFVFFVGGGGVIVLSIVAGYLINMRYRYVKNINQFFTE